MSSDEEPPGSGERPPRRKNRKARSSDEESGDQRPPPRKKTKKGPGAVDHPPPRRKKGRKERGGKESSSSKLPSGAVPPSASAGGPGDPFSYSTFERPTVVGQLHNILSQYPDNGQIIKELVQNAEDAGATRVEVVHFLEPLRQPGAREEVQRFIEGPGLCLFNDATFSEEDWHGIRKLGDSVKKNDPVRVGQFGLGFKSVFHLTDYVTIISGTQALFMDPSEPEDKMCRSLPLDKLTEVLPDPSSHQAFEYYLTKHLKADSNLPGTLFWFPLRRSASKISDTLYTPSHVENLFLSFAVEADICLTFLKSLEKVTLGIHTAGKVNVTHSMTITSRAAEEVRNKKRSFRQSLCQSRGSLSSALSCSYEATLTTRVRERVVQKQTLRVLHLLPGQEDKEWMTWTGRNKDKHIPLVGVAVPVSPPAAPRAKGHIFSFLPLPPDPSSQTDLPIQVNGTFVLSQNRRQVKWRTSESSVNEPDVVWNEDLVSKVVPRAYLELLKELLEEAKEGSFSADTWYTFLPSLRGTAGRWHEMAKQVWCGLLDLPVIATEVRGFLPPREVLASNILSEEEPELATAVRKALSQEKLPIATLPDHVQASIHALGQQLSVVTPELLCQTLQGKGSSDLGGEETCQQLLCYAAKDKHHHSLHGLPLLPLQDGSWSTFSRGDSDSAVYLCSAVEAKALLGLEGLMASTCVAQPAWEALQDVAHSGKTQLRPFQPELHGPDLLLKSASHVQRCQPPLEQVDQWLGKVWTLLQNLPLCSVENIPLLPTSQPPNSASLSPLSSPVVVQGKGGWLSRPQVEALGLLGVVVVPALPKHVQHKDLHEYLSAADRHGTTQALGKVVRQDQEKEAVTRFNTHKTEHQRQAVSSLIEVSSIQPPLAGFLTKLHMFKAQDTNKSEQDSHLEEVNTIAPELVDFPVSYPETLLTPTQHQEMELALKLGAHKLSKEELCIKALRSGHSDDSVLALVQYILEDPQLERSSSVREQLRNSKFVPNIDGSLCHPSELYDPEDEDHCVLIGEPQQPKDSFCDHYPLLRSLGLRKVQDMPQDELICLIEGLENSQLSEDDKARKSVGLLQAVNRRSDYLQVCRAVLGVPFVYGASSRPHGYPSSLGWATPPGPLVPQGLRSLKYSSVLGSTTALVECHDFPDVASAFGWASTPPVEPVIQHLKNLAAAYQLNEREYLDLIKQTYSQLSTALGEGGAPQLGSLKTECCVFTEHGFRLPDEVYIHPGDEDLRLLPYQHVLPFELRGSEQLFLCLGCARQQSPALLLAVLEKVRARHQGGGGSIDSSEVEKDRRLVMSVLGRLQHHLEELPGPLLVPVQTQDDVLELAEVQQAAYMEEVDAWLDSDELGVKVVHGCVATTLARALGVASLESFLTAGGEAVMEWGQREPLTTRLHNLLEQQYRDGVSILKELVQNADDAGATAVRLLYDERQNEDSRTLLLGPGMERCQGPALWVYNDAVFSEQDFENLREVGAGTKELQPTKIGKFGLGFSSVYNLTDVPSFISGSSYVVFDPHMTHLSHATSPGRRYNFTNRRHSYMLRTLRGQFQPFSGVFGCDVVERGSFEGTLFRLPFRTAASKISDMCYSRGDMVQLLGMFSGVVGQLLLFTQHVSSISVFHLSASASSPSEMVELFHAGRGRCQPALVPGLASPATDGPQSVLERAAALFSKQKNRFEWKGEILAERSTAEVSVWCSRSGADLCGLEEGQWSTTWVTSWHSGSGSAGKLAEALGGKALPLAAVAVPVREDRCGCHPLSLTDLPLGFYREGHFHCFLPLPVKTLLPVQINGVLEVASDRTNLLTETEDDRHAHSWNTTLVGDAALRAHLGLAEALRCLGLGAESPYHAIWPVVHHGAGTLVEGLTKGFYHALEHEGLELFRCSSGDWHPLARCRFLKQDFLQVPQVGDIAFEFMQTYFHSTSELRLVRLPQHILACLSEQVLSQQVNEEAFFSRYFIPHMSEGLVSPDRRDQLMLHLLDAGHPCLESLPGLPCIPTQPRGTLRAPAHLVEPGGRIARMFSVDDERFPVEEFLNSSRRSSTLARLGMNTDRLPRELVVERAESVAGVECSQCACDRVRELLLYMSGLMDAEQEELGHELRSVPFLPVMPKPEGWSIAWHGESPGDREAQSCSQHMDSVPESLVFDCPSALFFPKFKPLVGSCHLLLDQAFEDAPQGVLQRLGVITCALDLPLRSVMEQLCVFSAAPLQRENECMCHTVYEHLEDLILHVRRGKTLNSGNLDALGKLKEKKILVTKYGFKEPKLFALFSEVDCAPALFSVRTEGLEKYQHLMNTLGIKSHFDYKTVMEVIQEKRETFGSGRLSSNEVSRVSRLLTVLFQVKQSDQQLTQDLHLPDSKGYLHPTNLLCFDDGARLSSGQFLCLHSSITVSRDMLDWLGIKSKTRKRLQESSNRVPFGQNEPLTTRLKNILEDYPCDLAIMKELLQNADDAGATEVAFIKDFRHLPYEKLFDPKMAPLQGPALSVFNNRGFTEQDLRSIQNLGNSSKKEDPATTGQYGIGFNAVYHLTDAPSFLTRGPQVPNGETLCMFDPHCWYDPAASPQFPGVQFVNLSGLREDHPDSFIGYLESELPEEGTVFRLPLRTIRDSLIAPQETMTEEKVKEMLKEFQRGMPQCLLFLRNVRKISIKEVQRNGTFREEYWVEASVSEESHLPALASKYRDEQGVRDPCSLGMVRTSYTMTIRESQGSSSQWLVVQQQGVEKNSLPRQVQDAFTNKTLNLLPHGGVAIPFATMAPGSDCCSTSCYLPLPVRSGLPFSINGHFALDLSRRNLWTGHLDAKNLWNEWLIKEVLVPVAVHAVEQFRALMFDGEGYMTENTCKKETRVFHSVLPLASNATSEQWKYFIKEFYVEVRKKEFPFFDVFIPESDLSSAMKEASRVGRKGQLKWCAFHASGDSFPVHFSVISEQGKDHLSILADVFRRLGMKLSSEEMFQRLREADPQFECPLFTHETALTFLKSCNTGGPDCCQPKVGSKVADTPFLKANNVKSVLEYITKAKEFSLSSVDNLPLLLTNDGVLRCFSVQRPVFLSTFCGLLPAFGEEFTSCVLVQKVEANMTSFKDVVKEFTPADFVQRLPDDPGASGCVAKAKAPLMTAKHKRWLEDVWKFVVHYIEKHDEDSIFAPDRNKQYILTHLGKWAFYPMKEGNQEFVIPIKDAWQVLDVGDYAGGGSVFSKLPVPFPSCGRSGQEGKPHIPRKLKLEASLKEPVTVLELLYFHRESVSSFFIKDSREGGSRQVLTALEILEYLGQHCSRCQMSKDKIRSLQIFCDVSGEHSDLVGRNLIVLKDSCLSLHELESLCDKLRLFVTGQATCTLHVTELYTYIQPNCFVEETDWYAKYILPNISLLTEEKRMFFLDNLRSKLPNTSREMEWSEGQQRVVSALKKCPFIELNGTLRTADNIYDPSNPVFAVMGESNLPEVWREKKWRHLLKLAGMVCKVTPEKFIQFASLSPGDEHVRQKSKVLCEYLGDHLADFHLVMSQILDKEFLVPEKCIELATLLAHHQTRSGLLAFSEGVDPGRELAHVIWSTRSLLPVYAISVAIKLQAQYSIKVKMHTPPVEDILKHIEKLCSSLQKEPEKEPDLVKQVMESIYEYLSKNEDGAFGTLKDRDIPVVHIPEHRVFVPASWVVESLEEEILPHLYKAPTFYGKFFGTLKRLGMQTEASSDLYAKVLSKIHQDSGQEPLHPEEVKQMKMAMMGLVKRPPQLKDLSTSELYLPARDGTLRSSVEIFVADNMDMFSDIQETFKEPVFVGFEALQISFKEISLVKLLPQRLKPKFLSEVLQECLAHEDLEDVVTNFLIEVKELLQAEEFKTGVLRVIDHHRLGQGSGLSQDEKQEIVALLGRVRVRQVRKITTTVMLHGHGVGQRVKKFFFQMEGQGDQQTLTVYLCEKFPPRLLSGCLHKAYSLLLHKWSIERMMELGNVFGCVGKPHFIHTTLDQSDIKAYSAHSPARCLYMCDVGNYLEERFLPLLDNGFCSFSKGEIVCMKKYLCPCEGERRTEEDEDDIFVIVQVVRLVERHASCQMLDTYEVNTSQDQPCVVTVRASLLYRFVRREVRDVVLLQASAAEEENLNERDIFRKIRKQVKEIWGVEDEHQRRHLIRRLLLKWHPDKNPGREDLCTRLFQYIQSLLGRLERGEHIPDEEDEAQAPRTHPSKAYSSFSCSPKWRHHNFSSGRGWSSDWGWSSDGWWMPGDSSQERVPKSDLPEAQRWRRQAHCDLKAAEGMMRLDEEEWASWVVFMCYQAAEKMLLATLYSKDMEEACRQKGHGPLSRTLTTLALLLKDSHINRLADRIQNVACGFLGPLYPTFARCPRDGYTSANARRMCGDTKELLDILERRIE